MEHGNKITARARVRVYDGGGQREGDSIGGNHGGVSYE
jgi:hypothetical protein